MSKMNSKTVKKIVKKLKAIDDDPKFIELIESIKSKRFYGIYTDQTRNFEIVLEYLIDVIKQEQGTNLGYYTSEKLGILGWGHKLYGDIATGYIKPNESYRRISNDGIMNDISTINFYSLYPTLLSNAFKRCSLKITYKGCYGFDDLYSLMVDNYMHIRKEIFGYENSTYIFRFFINWCYGQISSPNNKNFKFHESSKCPIKDFHSSLIDKLKHLPIMHYRTDEIFIKSKENAEVVLNKIKDFIEKQNIRYEVEHHEKYSIENSSMVIVGWYGTYEYKKQIFEQRKNNKNNGK